MYDGETEEILLKSRSFDRLLAEHNIQRVGSIKYNQRKVEAYTNGLIRKGAQKVIILTDLEQNPCFSEVVNRFNGHGLTNIHKVVVVKKMIEAWLLADTSTLKKILKLGQDAPLNSNANLETEDYPYEKITHLINQHSKATTRKKKHNVRLTKVKLAKQFDNNGYTIANSAAHPNCHSAKYFIQTLKQIDDNFNNTNDKQKHADRGLKRRVKHRAKRS